MPRNTDTAGADDGVDRGCLHGSFVAEHCRTVRCPTWRLFCWGAVLLSVCFAAALPAAERYNEAERRATQQRLDDDCERARERKLQPRRRNIYQECMAKYDDDFYCYEDASGYNGVRIRGAPLFYDLPACVAAFEYRRKHRLR